MIPLLAALALAASNPEIDPDADLADRLAALCGQAFEGVVTSEDPRDADFLGQRLVMHVRSCDADEIRAPFHVGEDRSRTWVITRLEDGRLRLKHDHRHADGEPDVLTMYGGETVDAAAGPSAAFPADAESRALFEREGIPASMDNVWTMALEDARFVYRLERPGRLFEVAFDLTRPVDAPPAPWGAD